jgi:Glycosyl transferase family 41
MKSVTGLPHSEGRELTASAVTQPRVSVVCIGHDRAASARSCVETLARRDINCELVAPPDGAVADPGAALLAALRACHGEYIAFWPTQGELDPAALEIAAGEFSKHPHAGAVCGAGFLLDGNGNDIGRTDIVTLLFTSCLPFLAAGVFRRSALLACAAGMEGRQDASIELELCLRVAADFGMHNIGARIARGSGPAAAEPAIDERMSVLSTVFSDEGFWGPNKALLLEAEANRLGALCQRLQAANLPDAAAAAIARLEMVAREFDSLLRVDHRALRSLHRLFCTRSHNLGLLSRPLQRFLACVLRLGERAQMHIGYQIWNASLGLGDRLKRRMIAGTLPTSEFHPGAPSRARMLAELYGTIAARYEGRGQIEMALEMWELARPPDNVTYDSLAAQALLRLPSATDQSIADHQRLWVKRHIGEAAPVALPSKRAARGGKIRVGYHCAFMDLDTIRYMMRNVMKAHDRSGFEIYGYSPKPYPADLAPCIDVMRDTGTLSDEAFISLVRRDEIDVLVELTGFSPGNRFKAMSGRCAPVQVSFLNHTGSSHVPNVDYIITDEVCTPSNTDVQAYYSEKLWYLPGCFFCFDYRDSESPDPGEPPSASSGRPTFGCFGYGGKLNHEQIRMWAGLLQRCPTASLLLRNPQFSLASARRFVSSQFSSHGIAGDRLILAAGVDRRALLSEYGRVDVSLDTWPYCGGNTIAESFWMGVPVVSLRGARFSSRYGASLLAAAGCADLVAETPEQYIDIAARLAGDLPRLKTLRRNLREMSVAHGLGDSQRFARNLERAYTEMLGEAERQ